MARGRLTPVDRRSIAAGLEEGLAYAEIARRIGRPTSTVSREVARNGHRDYNADQAQLATHHRTPKRPNAARAKAFEDHRQAFVEELASVLTATGMSRMAARIFASFITSETDAVTAADLVRDLDVSPASVSKGVAYLEGMELVERHHQAGSRRERYRVGSDIWTRAIRADSSGHASVADAAQRGIALFGADTPVGTRLAQMGQFFANLTQQLRGSDLADPAVGDATTVIAALGHTRRRMSSRQLSTALGWPTGRLEEAVQQLRQRPSLADPFTVHESSTGYRLQARPDRLSAAQRAALDEPTTAMNDV